MEDFYDPEQWINPGEPGYDTPFADPTVPSPNMRVAMGSPASPDIAGSADLETIEAGQMDSGVGSYTPISEFGEPKNNSYSTSAPRRLDSDEAMNPQAYAEFRRTGTDGFSLDPTTGWVESPNQRRARLERKGGGSQFQTPALQELRSLAARGDPHAMAALSTALQQSHDAQVRERLRVQLKADDFTQADAIQLQKYAQWKAWVKQQLDQGLITPEAADELLRQMATPASALMAQKQITEKKKQQEQEQMQHAQIAKQEAINQENSAFRAKTMEQRISVVQNPKTGEEEYWLDLGPGKAPHRIFEPKKESGISAKPAKEETFDETKEWRAAEVEAKAGIDITGKAETDKAALHKATKEAYQKRYDSFYGSKPDPLENADVATLQQMASAAFQAGDLEKGQKIYERIKQLTAPRPGGQNLQSAQTELASIQKQYGKASNAPLEVQRRAFQLRSQLLGQ